MPDRRRGASARSRLSREMVARAGLAIADRDGLDALTMRRVATELGVGTMTLYGHVRDKEDLLDAVVDEASLKHRVRVPDGPWRPQIRELMVDLRTALLQHPSLVALRLQRPLLTPGALRLTEAGMEILVRAGFSKVEAARAYRALFVYTFGFAAFSNATTAHDVRDRGHSQLAAVPAEQYPRVAGAASELADVLVGDEPFEYGLDRLLDGLQGTLAQTPA